MTQTGKLVIIGSESRLDGTPLVIQGDPDPFGAATNSLLGKGLESGDCITVTGTIGKIGKVSVIFMIDATPAPGACA